MNYYRIIYGGGPYNGAIRYYSSKTTCFRVGKRYINRYSNRFNHCYIDIEAFNGRKFVPIAMLCY